jgi:hypothetical protein
MGENVGIPVWNAPSLLDRDYTITAEVTIPNAGAEGIIATTQHLMRAIRLFIAKEEGGGTRSSAAQERHLGPASPGAEKKASVSYQLSEQPSALLREEEFAKQLRLARYLAGASLGPPEPWKNWAKEREASRSRSLELRHSHGTKRGPRLN